MPSVSMNQEPGLILHFDIRNTVLVADSTNNTTVEQALNSYLTSVAWGTVDKENHCWEWYCDQPVPSLENPSGNKECINYYKFAETVLFPFPLDRVQFRRLTGDFVHTENGKPFQSIFDQHLSMFESPQESSVNAEPFFTIRGANGKHYHYILPSFRHLINHLSESKQKFAIVLRTYGLDAPNVLRALKLICEGKYPEPEPKPLDVTVNTKAARIIRLSNNRIALHRLNSEVLTCERSIQQYFDSLNDDGINTIAAVVDDFHYWKNNCFATGAGKPLWLDSQEKNLHIFFDDNIRVNDDDSIVDVRCFDKSSQQFCSLAKSQAALLKNRNLVQVDLLSAIANRDYFVEKLDQCVAKFKDSGT